MRSLLSILFVLILLSCGKEDTTSKATIDGQDLTLCACCGGWILNMADGERYLTDTIPLAFEQSELPLEVEIEWKAIDNNPCDKRIVVESAKR